MNPVIEKAKTDLLKDKDFFEGRNRRLSNLRLVFFVLSALCVFLAFYTGYKLALGIVGILLFGVFVVFCAIHTKCKAKLKLVLSKLECVERYIARQEGDFSRLRDGGDEFLVPGHDYASDLDLFGEHSIFALYNTSHFILGRKTFADLLGGKGVSSLTKNEIINRQSIVSKLEQSFDFLIDYEAVSNLNKIKLLPQALINLSKSKEEIKSTNKLLYKLAPLMWIIPLILYLVGNKYYKAAVLFVILINIIIWFISTRKYAKDFSSIGKVSSQANALSLRLSIILNAGESLKVLSKEYLGEDCKKSFETLKKACSLCAIRQQPIMALILNMFFPYDLLCADKLFSWSKNYGEKFLKDLDGIALIESYMSASTVGLVSKDSCFPQIDDRPAYFKGLDMKHPLLDPTKAVANSIELDSKSVLITGSNMSGKTTLIRTVGVISILAYLGAKVPAREASLSVMRVVSSMRIIDSIEGNMSTFKAELVRIGNIIKASEDERPMLFLIDEIFRGTNSADRTDGAEAVLRKLKKPYISGFMTTHDYALCDRATSSSDFDNVAFYHFSEKYEGENIIFDYKLKDGISNESNAKYLMRLVGIM